MWLGHTVYMIDLPPEEQKFGFMRGRGAYDGKFFASDSAFVDFVRKSDKPVYVALRREGLPRFEKSGVAFEKQAENLDMILLKVVK